MKSFCLTDSGKVRDHNEDNLIILSNENDEYLLAVADGMGGHKAGEVASSIAIDYLKDKFNSLVSIGEKANAIEWIRTTVSEINDKIFKYTYEHEESKGMGTTLVVCVLTKDFLLFGNIGDSSGYVLKNNKLNKITVDHTLVSLLVQSGELTLEEAKDHPKKNVLMKALGATSSIEMDIFDVENDVDGILLCSDGLTNMLDDDQITKVIIDDNITLDERLKKLVTKSNNRGGTDNISIAYLKDGAK